MLHFCNKLVISIFGAVFLHEWEIRGENISRGTTFFPVLKQSTPLCQKIVEPLPWAEGACPMPTYGLSSSIHKKAKLTDTNLFEQEYTQWQNSVVEATRLVKPRYLDFSSS